MMPTCFSHGFYSTHILVKYDNDTLIIIIIMIMIIMIMIMIMIMIIMIMIMIMIIMIMMARYVYNTETDHCREVSITPNGAWGGDGSLGCGIGYGYLHR